MSDTAPEHLLNRDVAKAQAAIDLACPLLRDLVDHSLSVLARCAGAHDADDVHTAVLLAYHALIEMVDGVEVLLASVAATPARLQVRAALEALLAIEYITETDSLRRARAYLVGDLQRALGDLKALDPSTVEGQEFERRRATTRFPSGMVDIAHEITPRRQAIERLLLAPRLGEVVAEFRAVQAKRKRPPIHWFSLFEGPASVSKLAEHLGRAVDYDLFYRAWSRTMHAVDAGRGVQRARLLGRSQLRPLRRHPRDFKDVATMAAYLINSATLRVLTVFRPDELLRGTYARWWEETVRPRHEALCAMQTS